MLESKKNTFSLPWEIRSIFMQTVSLFQPFMAAVKTLYRIQARKLLVNRSWFHLPIIVILHECNKQFTWPQKSQSHIPQRRTKRLAAQCIHDPLLAISTPPIDCYNISYWSISFLFYNNKIQGPDLCIQLLNSPRILRDTYHTGGLSRQVHTNTGQWWRHRRYPAWMPLHSRSSHTPDSCQSSMCLAIKQITDICVSVKLYLHSCVV